MIQVNQSLNSSQNYQDGHVPAEESTSTQGCVDHAGPEHTSNPHPQVSTNPEASLGRPSPDTGTAAVGVPIATTNGTTCTPRQFFDDISAAMRSMNLNDNPILQLLGIQVSSAMLSIPNARVIVPPSLRYGKTVGEMPVNTVAHLHPEDGAWDIWNNGGTDFEFYKPASIAKWGVFVTGCKEEVDNSQVDVFFRYFITTAQRKGVGFKEQVDTVLDHTDRENKSPQQNALDYTTVLSQGFKGCDLVFVVIPDMETPLYGHVKHAAEVNVGLLTQCILRGDVLDPTESVIQNLILKINTKMNGINHVIVPPILAPELALQYSPLLTECPVMIIGATVAPYPTLEPGNVRPLNSQDCKMPSFAAVVGSMGRTCMQFMSTVRAQARTENGTLNVIQNLKIIVKTLLDRYVAASPESLMPLKILYIRDGDNIKATQYAELLFAEMTAIREACKAFGSAYRPPISFLIVQRRHTTRMFHHVSDGEIKNVPAGTVTDTEIVQSNEFFLCSHKGTRTTTSRSTKYTVLFDDSEFSFDELQSLMYAQCFMSGRCTRSLALPAAVSYARLAASRAFTICSGFETKYGEPNERNMNRILDGIGHDAYPMYFV